MTRYGRVLAAPRTTRRRFLAGAAVAGAGAAAWVSGGCGEGKGRGGASPATATMAASTPVASRGGTLRVFNFDAIVADSLDPHLTQMGPIANVHAAVFSRVLRYDDPRAGTLAPDLADGMPEQPDETTYIIRLRQGAPFHDTPKHRFAYGGVAGRALQASDVKFSIERQASKASGRHYSRQADWSAVDRIDAVDATTVRIVLKAPVAPFLNFLAGRHAFVIAEETTRGTGEIASEIALIGTGPFMLDSLEAGTAVKLRRNPSWFARDDAAERVGGGRPFLDGYDAYLSPQEDEFQRVAFERRSIDATSFADPATADAARKTNLGDITMQESDAGAFYATRMLVDRAPFNDDRVRRALHLAIDRDALAKLMFPDVDGRASARLSGPVAPGMGRWAIADDDLLRRPGYRAAASQRDEDIATAKQLWAAAMGDAPIGPVAAFFGGAPRAVSEQAAPALQRQLKETLGVALAPVVDSSGYAVLASALGRNIDAVTEGVTAFTFALEDGGVDLDDWLYLPFRSGQPGNTYRLQDQQLDALLDKSRAEFDYDARRQIGLDVQDYLLAKVNARLEYFAPVERRLVWGYVRNRRQGLWYGDDEGLSDTWLDTSHAAWRGRSAG